MAAYAEIEEGLPRQVRLFHRDRLDDDFSPTEEHVALAACLRTNLPLNHHREFDEIGGADAATRCIMNHLDIQFQFRLSEEDSGQGGRVENHFGRPFSSYRKSAWSRYGRLTRAAARLAIARSSSALALPRRCGRRSKRSRRASVTTRVMVSPVSWAMAVASRWASGSLMLRDFIFVFSVKHPRFYHSTISGSSRATGSARVWGPAQGPAPL